MRSSRAPPASAWPPLAAVVGGAVLLGVAASLSGGRLRGTLAGYFVVAAAMSVMSVMGLALAGRFGAREIAHAALPVPGLLVGFAASTRVGYWLEGPRLRTAALAVAAVGGTVVLARALG